MSDIKITDAVAQTRGIKQFRSVDQEARVAVERLAAEAAAAKLAEEQIEVADTERAVDAKADEENQKEKERREAKKQELAAEEAKQEKKPPPPEMDMGHLFDFKA
jgi:hypothetical protein